MFFSQIVLGAGRNSFSDIRRLRRSSTKATMSTPEIVSPYELRGFWVRLSSDGTIEVGREGDDTSFMGWRDPQPLPIRYFAFCTWTGTVGKWEYDCPTNTTGDQVQGTESMWSTIGREIINIILLTSEVEESGLTWTQQLRRDLLTGYDPFVQPSTSKKETIIYLHLACQHVSLVSLINLNSQHLTFF